MDGNSILIVDCHYFLTIFERNNGKEISSLMEINTT
jgi:hypothetical protein